MKTLIGFCCVVAVLLLPGTMPWASAGEVSGLEVPVTLREAELLALQHSLQLQSQQASTLAAEAQVGRGYGIYDPTLNLSVTQGETRDLSTNQFPFSETGVDGRNYSASLDYRLFTGADLSLSLDYTRDSVFTELPAGAGALNPEHRTDLSLSLVQPLLKGFGRTLTEQEILFAVKDRDIALEDLRGQAFTVLSEVRKIYFDALGLRDNLRYRESSLNLARQVLEENRARVEVGVLPQVELLEAQVGVKTRERDLLDAERAYRDALDQLNLQINPPAPVRPSEEALPRPDVPLDEEGGVLTAIRQRPDLQRQLRQLERLQLQQTIDNNQLLPNLDVLASYGQKGIDASASESMGDSLDQDLRSWQVGLSFSYPLGNRAAEGGLASTRQRIRGQRTDLVRLRQEIRTEIRSAIRLVEVSRTKIDVAEQAKILSEEKLQILLGRKDVGLATTRDVLQGEEDLALASTDLITAVADYNKALTDYLQVTGQLLDHEGVRLVETVDDGLTVPAFQPSQP